MNYKGFAIKYAGELVKVKENFQGYEGYIVGYDSRISEILWLEPTESTASIYRSYLKDYRYVASDVYFTHPIKSVLLVTAWYKYIELVNVNPNYPNKCPKCKSPAYLGFNMVDCSNKGCK